MINDSLFDDNDHYVRNLWAAHRCKLNAKIEKETNI
jgi:hypothetical protein